MERKQFTFYRSFWESIQELPTKREKLLAYEVLCAYALEEKEPQFDGKNPSVTAIFRSIRPILDRAHQRARQAKRLSTVNTLSNDTAYGWTTQDIE